MAASFPLEVSSGKAIESQAQLFESELGKRHGPGGSPLMKSVPLQSAFPIDGYSKVSRPRTWFFGKGLGFLEVCQPEEGGAEVSLGR